MNQSEARRLADLLHAKREAAGLSIRETARRAGLDVATVARLE